MGQRRGVVPFPRFPSLCEIYQHSSERLTAKRIQLCHTHLWLLGLIYNTGSKVKAILWRGLVQTSDAMLAGRFSDSNPDIHLDRSYIFPPLVLHHRLCGVTSAGAAAFM